MLPLLNKAHAEILALELPWRIRLLAADPRPRIELFHDAVRALEAGEGGYEKHSRLSVERLAYDIAQLRAVQEKPLGLIDRTPQLPGKNALVKTGESTPPKQPPSSVRHELLRLYKEYTVFFVAVFAPAADRNFMARTDTMEAQQADLDYVEKMLQQMLRGELTQQEALEETVNIEMDALRERMQAMLQQKKLVQNDMHEALGMLASIERGVEKEQRSMEQAHTHYATGQLAVLQESKDLVKKLAASGLNVAGKHLESAVKSAQQGKGKGL